MPQHIQHSLIHILLLWTTVLSIIQVVSIVLFFKVDRFSQCQNCSAVAQDHKMQSRVNNKTWSNPEFPLAKGKMANFVCKEVHENKTIKWEDQDHESSGLLSNGYVLETLKDGYYFLNLRVTLECGGRGHTKIIMKKGDDKILQGWIDAQTCSTGVLSKVERLPARTTLMVTIETNQTFIDFINTDVGSFTSLNVIYMENVIQMQR